MKKRSTDYPYLRAWHYGTGSSEPYVNKLLQQARQDHAPDDAVYWSPDRKRWVVFSEISSARTREWLLSFAENYR